MERQPTCWTKRIKTRKDGSDVNTIVETAHWTAQRLWMEKHPVPEGIMSLFFSALFEGIQWSWWTNLPQWKTGRESNSQSANSLSKGEGAAIPAKLRCSSIS